MIDDWFSNLLHRFTNPSSLSRRHSPSTISKGIGGTVVQLERCQADLIRACLSKQSSFIPLSSHRVSVTRIMPKDIESQLGSTSATYVGKWYYSGARSHSQTAALAYAGHCANLSVTTYTSPSSSGIQQQGFLRQSISCSNGSVQQPCCQSLHLPSAG
jgi:hypothetical protein